MLEGLKDKDEGVAKGRRVIEVAGVLRFGGLLGVGDVAGRSDRRMAADGSLGIITALKGSWPFTRMLF